MDYLTGKQFLNLLFGRMWIRFGLNSAKRMDEKGLITSDGESQSDGTADNITSGDGKIWIDRL